ncbi:MAG: NUDIX hydrolase [Lachnospiraceae bacterium]|nr:NUDIX hydrolase [Lachnospiraceae bacterium]
MNKEELKMIQTGEQGIDDAHIDDDDLAWEEIESIHLVQDEWIDFRRLKYKMPDGKVFEPYYSYSRRNYVVIVAVDTDGNFLCVRQFRQGIRQVTTEFPAGGIEKKDKEKGSASSGDDKGAADALTAAKRELREETGYESEKWQHLLSIASNATLADNYAHIFLARDCHRVTEQSLDEMEFLNVLPLPAVRIEEMIKDGEFQQVVHVTAYLLALRYL